ncbi:hypothetical protein [Priestia endophytica]|nr:hypothetical protein [Priestia endophytica]MCY8235313.1 hypothetical protein [Priestia endophytica]
MKNKILFGLAYALSLVAGFTLFFIERKYRKKHEEDKGNIIINKSYNN